MEQSGIARACEAAGGQQALAEHLHVTQQTVSTWVVRGFAAKRHVPRIAEHTGVPARELYDPAVVRLIEK